jgi:hypothetical protein
VRANLCSSAVARAVEDAIVARVHRTTTTATLLVTVAVSALSGCVTVQRPPASGPPAAPTKPSAPRPDGRAEPQVVQAPAREALEMIGPSRHPDPTEPAPHPAHRSAPTAAQQPPVPRSHPHPHPHPRQAHPKPHHPHHAKPQPGVEIPDVTQQVPKNTADVCALGRKYGGWKADSPESLICKQSYGR